MGIKLTYVQSSQIAAMGWEDGTMAVQFKNGKVWHYQDVPEDVFIAVRDDPSVGRAFIDQVREVYTGTAQ